MSFVEESGVMVNGPFNIVRLEGYVGIVKKVIYICYDRHIPSKIQTKCDSGNSIDIDKYLEETFLNSPDNTYDLFLEISPTRLDDPIKDGAKYISTVKYFFRTMFNYDSTLNKVHKSKLLDNVRFHYIDIRDFIHRNCYSNMKHLHNSIRKSVLTKEKLNYVSEFLIRIKNHILKIISCFGDYRNITKKIIVDKHEVFDIDKLKNIIKKVRTMYHNKIVANILSHEVDITQSAYGEVVEMIDNFVQYINQNIDNPDISIVTQKCSTRARLLDNALTRNNAKLTDIYMLRRFLDKSYITNAISYTGGNHSNYYVYILVKYFDFTITNFSHSTISDLDLLNDSVKNANDIRDLESYFFSEDIHQCSDISDFPGNLQ